MDHSIPRPKPRNICRIASRPHVPPAGPRLPSHPPPRPGSRGGGGGAGAGETTPGRGSGGVRLGWERWVPQTHLHGTPHAPTCRTTSPTRGSPCTAASHPRRPLRPAAGGGPDWRRPSGGFGLLRRRLPPPALSRSSSAEVRAPSPLLLHLGRCRPPPWWIPAYRRGIRMVADLADSVEEEARGRQIWLLCAHHCHVAGRRPWWKT